MGLGADGTVSLVMAEFRLGTLHDSRAPEELIEGNGRILPVRWDYSWLRIWH
jgi:hypothetical protein